MYNNDSDSLNAGAYANLQNKEGIRLTGNQQMASMEAGQEGTLEDIYDELLGKGFSPREAAEKAKDIYNDMQQDMAQGGRAGIMAAAPQTYTQRRKQNMAYGGIAGLDGRRQYGLGSWFQEKIKDPIAKLIPNELKNPATAVVAGSLLDKYGLPDFLPGDLGQVGEGWLGKTAEAIGDVPYVGKVLGPVAKGVQRVGETIGNIPSQIGSIFTGGENKNKEIENIFKIPESQRTIEQKLAIEAWERATQSGTGSAGSGIMDTLFGANEQGVNYKIPMAIGAAAGLAQQKYIDEQPPFPMDDTGINFQTAQQAMDDPNLRFKPKLEDTQLAAEGGRIGYAGGGGFESYKDYLEQLPNNDKILELYAAGDMAAVIRELKRRGIDTDDQYAQGGRIGYNRGRVVNPGGYAGDVEIPEQFLEDFKRKKYEDIMNELERWKNFQKRQRDFGPGGQEVAEGGRIGYAGGGSGGFSIDIGGNLIYIPIGSIGKTGLKDHIYHGSKGDVLREDIVPHLNPGGASYAQGGRIGAQEGGLMNLGGMEKDYRQEGGFVPIGGKEKADDVPARLSKNEFVFTADAVRGAGGGDIDKGAEIMENMMKSLESGGEVSEESQGLEGARGMFANAQQLQKRII